MGTTIPDVLRTPTLPLPHAGPLTSEEEQKKGTAEAVPPSHMRDVSGSAK